MHWQASPTWPWSPVVGMADKWILANPDQLDPLSFSTDRLWNSLCNNTSQFVQNSRYIGGVYLNKFRCEVCSEHHIRWRSIDWPTDRPTDLSTYRSAEWPINLTVDRPIYQPTGRSTDLSTYRSTDRPINLPIDRPTDLTYRSTDRPINLSIDRPTYQPTDRPTDLSIYRQNRCLQPSE